MVTTLYSSHKDIWREERSVEGGVATQVLPNFHSQFIEDVETFILWHSWFSLLQQKSKCFTKRTHKYTNLFVQFPLVAIYGSVKKRGKDTPSMTSGVHQPGLLFKSFQPRLFRVRPVARPSSSVSRNSRSSSFTGTQVVLSQGEGLISISVSSICLQSWCPLNIEVRGVLVLFRPRALWQTQRTCTLPSNILSQDCYLPAPGGSPTSAHHHPPPLFTLLWPHYGPTLKTGNNGFACAACMLVCLLVKYVKNALDAF